MVTGQRHPTLVPTQSLYLLNSPYDLSLASSAAVRLMREERDPARRVNLAYQRWFGRLASETEQRDALAFVERYRQQTPALFPRRRSMAPEMAAWGEFCQSLWAAGEFLIRN